MESHILHTVTDGYDLIDTLSRDEYVLWIDSLGQKAPSDISLVEQFFLTNEIWSRRLSVSHEKIMNLYTQQVLSLIVQEEDLVGQYLEYLYILSTQNTKKEEDKLAVQSAFATMKKGFLTSEAVLVSGLPTATTQKSLIEAYTHILNKTQDSIELANWMTMVQQLFISYSQQIGLTDNTPADLYQKTKTLKELIDFFLGVHDTAIYPLVLRHRFPEMFEESTGETIEEVVQEDTIKQVSYTGIQTNVIAEFGDITDLTPATIAPVLTYLSEQSETLADPRIAELIYFDATTGAFVWNDDLLNQS